MALGGKSSLPAGASILALSLCALPYRAGSGIKLHTKNLRNLTLNLGSHTTEPLVSVGVSVNYAAYTTVNVSAGANVISLPAGQSEDGRSVVRITTEGWQNNRMQLESIAVNHVRQRDHLYLFRRALNELTMPRKRDLSPTCTPRSGSKSLVTPCPQYVTSTHIMVPDTDRLYLIL